MKKNFTLLKVLLSVILLSTVSFSYGQNDQINIRNNAGTLPAYNPQAPVVGNANVNITSALGRTVAVSYKNATSMFDGSNTYVILGAAAFGIGTIEFNVPAGVGTLKYTIETGSSIEPVVYINSAKKSMTTGIETTVNLTGVVSIKMANESTNPAYGVIVLSIYWTDCVPVPGPDQINIRNNASTLPAYNPQAPVVGNANVNITSSLGRQIAVSYKNATSMFDGSNTYVILGAAAFGIGTIEFNAPYGLGTLKYTIETGSSIEPVVYVNSAKKSMTTGIETTVNLTGVVSIKMANESTNPAYGVIVLSIYWTNYVTTGISDVNNFKVEMYPNPTNGKVNISIEEDFSNAMMTIYNSTGMLVDKFTITGTKISYDLSNKSGGVYFFELTLDNKKLLKKIILNK